MVRWAGRALVGLLVAGCASSGGGAGAPAAQPTGGETARQTRRANPADATFMSGMIHHHAQAIVMAGWAASHGANEAIQTLAKRIIVSQTDEIKMMQLWLSDHGEPVPEPSPEGQRMVTGGVEHHMLMHGMLTPEQMAELDRARGEAFDRLFLRYMIQHHEGALQMVQELFASYGGGVDDFVYKVASDTFADQGSEIDRMQRMLDAMDAGAQGRPPQSLHSPE